MLVAVGIFLAVALIIYACRQSNTSNGGHIVRDGRIYLRGKNCEGWYLELPYRCNKNETPHVNLWGPSSNDGRIVCHGALNITGFEAVYRGPDGSSILRDADCFVKGEAMSAVSRNRDALYREYQRRAGS